MLYSVKDAVGIISCIVRDNVKLATQAFMVWKRRIISLHPPDNVHDPFQCVEAARKDLYMAKPGTEKNKEGS